MTDSPSGDHVVAGSAMSALRAWAVASALAAGVALAGCEKEKQPDKSAGPSAPGQGPEVQPVVGESGPGSYGLSDRTRVILAGIDQPIPEQTVGEGKVDGRLCKGWPQGDLAED